MFEQGLVQIENQSFYFNVGANLFNCRLFGFHGLMYMDVSINNDSVASGIRLLPNTWILPVTIGLRFGNMRFETSESDKNYYVDWNGFNDAFKLKVYPPDEFQSEFET